MTYVVTENRINGVRIRTPLIFCMTHIIVCMALFFQLLYLTDDLF